MRGVCITKGSMRSTVPDDACSEGEWLKTGNGFEPALGSHLKIKQMTTIDQLLTVANL